MKHIFSVILLFFMSFLFSQNLFDINFDQTFFENEFPFDKGYQEYISSEKSVLHNEIIKILFGDITILDSPLDIFSLAKTESKFYRIIRNMIYAKHGYIFISPEIQRFFLNYSWYKPIHKNIDNFLTNIDKYNLQLIIAFESMNESLPSINWNNEKIGVWQDDPIMADGWSNRFIIFADDKLEYYYSQMKQLPLLSGMLGNYQIKGNVLEFKVDSMKYTISDFDIELSGAFGYSWEDSEINTVIFEKPIIYRFPVSIIEKKVFGQTLERNMITIGGIEYYKLSEDTDGIF